MVTSCCSSPASLFNAFQALCVLFPWFSLISSSVWDSVPSCCSWMFEPSLGLLGPSNTLTNLDVSPHPLQPFLIALICLPAVPSLSLSLSLSLPPPPPLWYLEACIFCQYLQRTCFWFCWQFLLFHFLQLFSFFFYSIHFCSYCSWFLFSYILN